MRIFTSTLFSALAILLLGVGHPPHPRVLDIPVKLKSADVPLSKLDPRFGNMVAEVPCTIPFVFVNGTIADATQVNANFNAILTCLSTIYASDIIPTSPGQATFGGTIQYSFPTSVAVAGGQFNPYTDTSGPLWLQQNGANPGAYALAFAWANCGSSGAIQLFNGVSLQSFFDCQGNYHSGGGSIIQNGIVSGNGNFTAPSPNPLVLCIITCNVAPGNFQATFGTNGVMTFPGPVLGVPSPAPANSPAPYVACYYQGGLPCGNPIHMVSFLPGSPLNATLTTCPANGLCTAISGNTQALTGAAAFTNAPNCAATGYSVAGLMVTLASTSTGSNLVFQVFNTGAAISTGTGIAITWVCWGI